MAEYSSVRGGKLHLKGAAGAAAKKRKKKRKREEKGEESEPGLVKHGRWRRVGCIEEMRDKAVFETYSGGFIFAEDTGCFSVSDPRTDEESLDPAETFTVVKVSETKVALKSGYGRYVGVNTAGELIGRAEAVGPRETWEPVFEEGKLALCACNHRFLTVSGEGKLMAVSEKAREKEILTMRCDAPMHKRSRAEAAEEEEWSTRDMQGFEINYVKKFQSFKDHRLRVCDESRDGLDRAKREGKLHEALLDRREKMKADRYCK